MSIEFGKRLVDVRDDGVGGVIACFEDDTEERSDVVIGCDGIHSPTRRSIFPHAPEPSYTGVLDSGPVTRTDGVPETGPAMRMIFGRCAFLGYTRTPTGDVYWFSNHHEPREPARGALERIPDREWRARLLDLHRDDPDPVVRVIESTEGRIGRWPIYDLPSLPALPLLPAWHRGRVGLIGDAAHATSPHVGGGASSALEDAIVLAECLRDVSGTEAALARCHALRKDRVEQLVCIARRTGNQKAVSNPILVWMCDLLMPFFLKRAAGSPDWIYSYRVEWETSAARAGAERAA